MRKEASNTFTDGLIQDLNPINTPNTMLTDNLNGTIITYDGNEYSLQNDRGNYPLQYCRLKPNYIPVGVKEYADTLYIVSHNPLDGKTEIGSYPSPLEISSSNEKRDGVNLTSLIQQSVATPDYTDLIQKAKMHVFSDEELKIYPGDEYQINLQDESKYIYEELEYYIIDENRNKYNITEHIKENSAFSPVGWTVPGWMAVQYRLAVFEDFQMNTRSFTVPTLAYKSDGALNLNFQLKISDKLLLNRLPGDEMGHLDEFGLSIKIQKQSVGSKSTSVLESGDFLFDSLNGQVVEWYEASKILWAQKEFNLSNLNQGDKLTISATPFIQVTVDGETYKVVYDNFTENLDITLTNIGSYSDFKIAENTWKFWVEEDDTENLYLEFDIAGPIITSNTVNLYYKIDDIESEEQTTTYYKLESYNGVGQNMLLIPFNKTFFTPEGIYIIEFVFSDRNPSDFVRNEHNSYSIKKLVIASQIFSGFVTEVQNFENITFDAWTSKYPETVKNSDKWDLQVDSNMSEDRSYSKGVISKSGLAGIDIPDCLMDFYTTGYHTEKYKHTAFITEDEWDETVGEQTKFIRGYITTANAKLSTEMKVLDGKLWDGMARSLTVKVKSHDDELSSNSYSILNLPKVLNLSLRPIVGNTCTVTYDKESEGLVRGSTSKNNTSVDVSSGVKYGILVGGNRKSGSNWYIEPQYNYVNRNLSENGADYPTTVSNFNDLGNKESVPNGLTRSIVSFMTRNNLPFMVMFVVTRPVNDKKGVGLYRDGEKMFSVSGTNVSMQPFVVFKNRQNNPLFFAIDGYDYIFMEDAEGKLSGQVHDFPFKEWQGLSDFVKHMNSILSGFVKYDIKGLTDGYFINCKYEYDDLDSILNIETEVNMPEITKWNVGQYDILNSTDRSELIKKLLEKDVSCGNLFTGVTSKLNAINIDGVEYNYTVQTPNSVKTALKELSDQLDEINNNSAIQWDSWKTDDVYLMSEISEINGISMIDKSNTAAEKFKQSALYELIQKSDTDESMVISASGENLMYQVTSVSEDAAQYIGLIHSSITFP